MRIFASVVLVALLLLPRTGWVVRSHADLLAGGWGRFGVGLGIRSESYVVEWPLREGALRDVAASALIDPPDKGSTSEDMLRRAEPALAEPSLRAKVRGPVLRRSFTAILPKTKDRAVSDWSRRLAQRMLPLALEGERAEPENAFYPACAWTILSVLERPAEADAALSRAAGKAYYDDAAAQEARVVRAGIENEYGYRGNLLRLNVEGSILLPQYAAMNDVFDNEVGHSPLDDTRRGQAIRLGQTMVRTGESQIAVFVGRSLILRAIGGGGYPFKGDEARLLRSYAAANPGFDRAAIGDLLRRSKVEEFGSTDLQGAMGSSAAPYGAALLVALAGALALAWPAGAPLDESLRARVGRASWAWLGLFPAAVFDGGPSAPGLLTLFGGLAAISVVCLRLEKGLRLSVAFGTLAALGAAAASPHVAQWLSPSILWAAAILLPPKARSVGFGLGLLVAGAAMAWSGLFHAGDLLGMLTVAAFLVALRRALPLAGNTAWLPGALAAAYLVTVVLELSSDAQAGEVLRAFETEARSLRKERGILGGG